MPTVALLGPWKAAAPTPPRHPRAYLATDAGHRLEIPFAPREVELGGLAYSYAIIPRPGRKALVLPDSEGLRTLSFELFIGRPDHQQAVEDLLHTLREIAAGKHRITIGNLGPDVALNAWRMTGYTQRSILRQYGTNAITRATVPLEFTEASDVAIHVGPLTGGAKTAPKPTSANARPGAPTPRIYVLPAGQTLTAVAQKFYGNGSLWPSIAKANKINDPRKVRAGTRLIIPAKP